MMNKRIPNSTNICGLLHLLFILILQLIFREDVRNYQANSISCFELKYILILSFAVGVTYYSYTIYSTFCFTYVELCRKHECILYENVTYTFQFPYMLLFKKKRGISYRSTE